MKVLIFIFLLVVGQITSAQQLFIRNTGPYYSELNSSFVRSGDTTLFQYSVVENQDPYTKHAANFVWINKSGNIIKQQEILYESRDSGLYFYRILDDGRGRWVGFGVSPNSNLEMVTFSSDLSVHSVVSIALDSGSTIAAVKRNGQRFIIITFNTKNKPLFLIYNLDKQIVERTVRFDGDSIVPIPYDMHYREKDSSIWMVSMSNPVLGDQTQNAFVAYIDPYGNLSEVTGVNRTSFPMDSIYFTQVPSFVDINDSLFYISSVTRLNLHNPFRSINLPIVIKCAYDVNGYRMSDVLATAPEYEPNEQVERYSLKYARDTLWQVTTQIDSRRFKVLAYDLNLKVLHTWYVPYPEDESDLLYLSCHHFDVDTNHILKITGRNNNKPLYQAYYYQNAMTDTLFMGIAEDQRMKLLRLNPNPCRDRIRISDGGCYDVEILNAFGQLVKTEKSVDGYIDMDETPGLYFVKISRNGVFRIEKVVKE